MVEESKGRVYSNQNGDQWINNRLGKSRAHTYRLAANIQLVELAFILLDQYYPEYKHYNDHKADNIFRLRMIDLANRFLNRTDLSERVQLDIHFQVVQSAINTVLMNINQYECFFSGYGLTRKPHNMVNDEEISPSSTDDGDNQQQTNFTESVMISPGNGGEVQRKRHHTNSSDLYEEENLDKVEMDGYISNDKHYSKRSKLKKSSSMDDRVRSITEKILQFKHIGFTLCQISSYSSKWKDEREKAINQLCDLNLLIRIPRGVKTSTSRPFDYHIKLPPLDFSDFTENMGHFLTNTEDGHISMVASSKTSMNANTSINDDCDDIIHTDDEMNKQQCDKHNHQYSMVDQVYSSMNDQTSALTINQQFEQRNMNPSQTIGQAQAQQIWDSNIFQQFKEFMEMQRASQMSSSFDRTTVGYNRSLTAMVAPPLELPSAGDLLRDTIQQTPASLAATRVEQRANNQKKEEKKQLLLASNPIQ
ncbi:unnamed protein product [Didymodactylos carnosus]|uniref:Uncharacterized protein n=1 Tax=Didymodactylos carnosus TaxID=1234261 RepID=A0A814IRA2_9BILA|nr:unnamed protein product [Didymodactylos carnosus]CAF3796357.1 unnamed protein product [Didymodactylos carnosus]